MYYFAYGASLSKKHMKETAPESKPLYSATLPNYKLIFAGRSAKWHGGIATILRSSGDKVRGGIYDISEADLRKLDTAEGYPRDYNRLNITVFDEDGNAVKAITYIKAGTMAEAQPSKEYLAVIQQGYRDWGLYR